MGLEREMKILSVCSGLGSEQFVVGGLGLPVAHGTTFCDTDATSRRFIKANHGDMAGHIFHDMSALGGSGLCEMHGCTCVDDTGVIDGVIGGPPCTPFSRQRAAGMKAVPPHKHEKWAATFGREGGDRCGFLHMLRRKLPLGGVFENVTGMSTSNLPDGRSPLVLFLEELRAILNTAGEQQYTGVQVLKLDPMPFLNMCRPRLSVLEEEGKHVARFQRCFKRSVLHIVAFLRPIFGPRGTPTILEHPGDLHVLLFVAPLRYFVVFASDMIDGQVAVDWMASLIAEMIQYRAIGAPIEPKDMLAAANPSKVLQDLCLQTSVRRVYKEKVVGISIGSHSSRSLQLRDLAEITFPRQSYEAAFPKKLSVVETVSLRQCHRDSFVQPPRGSLLVAAASMLPQVPLLHR
jgi:hypothetical protein